MAIHTLRPTSPSESDPHHGDFVLFGEDPIYAASYRQSFAHPGTNLFHGVVQDVQYPEVLGQSNIHQQQQNNMNPFYSLGTSSIGAELPIASSAPGYDHHIAYSPYSTADVPRTTYMTESLTAAPGVLIHPPTLSYHTNQYPHPGEYQSTPSTSPTASVCFEGSGSGLSGSEAGSMVGSPKHHLFGVEDHMRSFGVVDATFATGIDPTLVSNSPLEPPPLSAGSPYGSPAWGSMHSPQAASNPGSPDLRIRPNYSGRLTPSGASSYSSRHAPYPQRRPSAGSVHSHRSIGSPNMNSLDHKDGHIAPLGYLPSRSPSQRSNGSARRIRANGSPDSVNSATGSTAGPTKEAKETLCIECNKTFRDLRAHQLTHQSERPEKCPIATCEYSRKGFARKYDCQRHTLTHYKGTMVCGFCPGSGSATEKSFNRADVFKRHLMSVHNVEQTPPNGRQRKTCSKGKEVDDEMGNVYTSGKCSTCSITFATAQQFYEHLDDCVLSKVVEEEPAAVANERNLSQIKLEDFEEDFAARVFDPEDDDEEELGDVDEVDDDEEKDETYIGASSKKARGRRAPATRSKGKTLKRSGSGNIK